MENLDEKQFSVELDFMTRSVIEMGFNSIKDYCKLLFKLNNFLYSKMII